MGPQELPLTVILWLWHGWRPIYTHQHVNAMVGMLFDHMTVPHRVVCITDRPSGIECETFPLWNDVPHVVLPRATQGAFYPNSYRRLKMFSPWAAEAFPGRILSIDLDCVVYGDMTPIITDDDFKINIGKAAPYNGGMWQLRTGTRTQVWERFSPNAFQITKRQRYTGSDQAWISHVLKDEKTWGADDGVYHYSMCRLGRPPDNIRMMFCAGGIKPWHPEFIARFPKLAAHYKGYLK